LCGLPSCRLREVAVPRTRFVKSTMVRRLGCSGGGYVLEGMWIWPLLPSSSDDELRSKTKTEWGASPTVVIPWWFGSPLWQTSFAALFKALVPLRLSWPTAASYLHGLPPATSVVAESGVGWRFRRTQRPQRTCMLFPSFVGASVSVGCHPCILAVCVGLCTCICMFFLTI
jgi:hypothetical protein